jgi:integrase
MQEDALMAVGKVTNASIANLDGWMWDHKLVGFGARKQIKGVHFYVRYRIDGTQVVKSIGRLGPWTCDTARNEAKRLLGIVASGVDPYAQSLSSETFGAEIERYLLRKRTSLRPSWFAQTESYLCNYFAPLHKLLFAEIDRRKVSAILGEIETNSGPIARNRARAALSAFYTWAIQEGFVDQSPVVGTGKATEGASRDRVLSPDELKRLWRSLGDGRFADIVRLLLLTGQRRTEIGRLTWSEVDLDRKLIVLGPERTKNSRPHEVPLSTQALAILTRQPKRTEFVFSRRGFMNWADAKARLDQRVGIAPFRLHDLRRSCATGLAELGINPWIIEVVLNHYSKSTLGAVELPGHRASVAGIYNRAKYEGEMRSALQRWADHLDRIVQ